MLEKKIEKEVWHFSNQEFSNEEDALKAAQKMEKQWCYHRISAIEVVERKKKKDEEANEETNDEACFSGL